MIDPDTRPTGTPPPATATARPPATGETVRYWTMAAVATGLIVVQSVVLGDDSYERFVGRIPPPIVAVTVVAIGAISLRVLARRGWLPVGPLPLARLYRLGLLGVVVAIPAVVVDTWIPFPEDMNTPWPGSLWFYPAVALVAGIVFQLAPLALLLTALRWDLDRHPGDRSRAVRAIVIVAAVETLFHTVDAVTGPDRRLALFVVPQLTAVGVCQLAVLRRYGLAAMVTFRLGYYLIWHVAWGAVRLAVLF